MAEIDVEFCITLVQDSPVSWVEFLDNNHWQDVPKEYDFSVISCDDYYITIVLIYGSLKQLECS